jgi:hypothetical protein
LLDCKAEVNAQLEQAFNTVLDNLNDAPDPLGPQPSDVEIYRTSKCVLVRLPEPIEFARIAAVYAGFDVLCACSPDERSWLIFPADTAANSFAASGVLSFTYHLDIGPHLPRLGYTSNVETVAITL